MLTKVKESIRKSGVFLVVLLLGLCSLVSGAVSDPLYLFLLGGCGAIGFVDYDWFFSIGLE